ncbi:hypothetical protein [Paraburkholderia dipogonis]|uniref:hypothetical protein n=1 Tax=Paraburkholderia dipogonis TaxID=1211383 RepID=UPI0038B97A0A
MKSMNGAASEIRSAPLIATQRSRAGHGSLEAVIVTRSISSQQSAAPDEARDTVRAANASIDGSINAAGPMHRSTLH